MKTFLKAFLLFILTVWIGNTYSQTNPEPYPLIVSDFILEGIEDSLTTDYPPHTVVWAGPVPQISPTAKPSTSLQATGDAPLLAFSASATEVSAKNEGSKLISIRGNDGDDSPLAFALALNTQGTSGLKVKWTVRRISGTVGLVSGVQLQYRNSTAGDWTNFGNTYRYTNSNVSRDTTYGPLDLPAELEGKDSVQFRWLTFSISDLVGDHETNRLSVDDIEITATTREALLTPVANFGFDAVGKEVSFTDSSSNSPTTWAWDFGDSNVDSIQNPVHTYSSAGTYMVQLIAANSSGADTIVKEVEIVKGGDSTKAPEAAFSFIVIKDTVMFFDESDNFPQTFAWDFGDGATDSIANPVHVYDSAGIYTVCLIASNENGSDTLCTEVEPDFTIGLNTINKNKLFSIYPNPSNGLFTLSTNSSSSLTLNVFDMMGAKVFETQVLGSTQNIDLSKLNKGMYLLTLSNGKEMSTQKISLF